MSGSGFPGVDGRRKKTVIDDLGCPRPSRACRGLGKVGLDWRRDRGLLSLVVSPLFNLGLESDHDRRPALGRLWTKTKRKIAGLWVEGDGGNKDGEVGHGGR